MKGSIQGTEEFFDHADDEPLIHADDADHPDSSSAAVMPLDIEEPAVQLATSRPCVAASWWTLRLCMVPTILAHIVFCVLMFAAPLQLYIVRGHYPLLFGAVWLPVEMYISMRIAATVVKPPSSSPMAPASPDELVGEPRGAASEPRRRRIGAAAIAAARVLSCLVLISTLVGGSAVMCYTTSKLRDSASPAELDAVRTLDAWARAIGLAAVVVSVGCMCVAIVSAESTKTVVTPVDDELGMTAACQSVIVIAMTLGPISAISTDAMAVGIVLIAIVHIAGDALISIHSMTGPKDHVAASHKRLPRVARPLTETVALIGVAIVAIGYMCSPAMTNESSTGSVSSGSGDNITSDSAVIPGAGSSWIPRGAVEMAAWVVMWPYWYCGVISALAVADVMHMRHLLRG